MTSGLELAELSATEFAAHLDTLTGIYAAAMNQPALQLAGRRSVMERHACYAGLRVVAALTPPGRHGGAIAGFAYGFHGARGQWWHDLVRDTIATKRGPDVADEWLADSFEIAEVHVRPEYQGRGTGRAMMLRLTAGQPEPTAVLSTMDADTRAHRLYRWLGFADLLGGFAFPGADMPYVIMAAKLPLRHLSARGPGPSGKHKSPLTQAAAAALKINWDATTQV